MSERHQAQCGIWNGQDCDCILSAAPTDKPAPDTRRDCTCVYVCHKKQGSTLGANWRCRVEHERDNRATDKPAQFLGLRCPECRSTAITLTADGQLNCDSCKYRWSVVATDKPAPEPVTPQERKILRDALIASAPDARAGVLTDKRLLQSLAIIAQDTQTPSGWRQAARDAAAELSRLSRELADAQAEITRQQMALSDALDQRDAAEAERDRARETVTAAREYIEAIDAHAVNLRDPKATTQQFCVSRDRFFAAEKALRAFLAHGTDKPAPEPCGCKTIGDCTGMRTPGCAFHPANRIMPAPEPDAVTEARAKFSAEELATIDAYLASKTPDASASVLTSRLRDPSLSCSKGQRGDIHREAADEIDRLSRELAEARAERDRLREKQ